MLLGHRHTQYERITDIKIEKDPNGTHRKNRAYKHPIVKRCVTRSRKISTDFGRSIDGGLVRVEVPQTINDIWCNRESERQ